MHDSTKEFET